MTDKRVEMIAGLDRNGLIGDGDRLPWRLPADLKHFRRITMGHPIVMGRATWESLPGVLDGRQNIVLSRRAGWELLGAERAGSVDEALALARSEPVIVIGGAQVYARFLPLASRLHLTEIESEFDGDTWFPRFDRADWVEVACEEHDADAQNPWPYRFVTLDRRA